ncbi:MAG: hypothetical protein PHC33_04585 [Candidatus Omnitrophica bacterium]|nr:hypothetical protein [Candidatus Omnitrophota bacterium]
MKKEIQINFDDFEEKGLYLIFPDGGKLGLTRVNIEQTVDVFWRDPARIPEHVKKAAEFRKCSICPLREQQGMCYAIRPTMPFLDIVDKYVSCDEVTAVFKREKDILHVSATTMQKALEFVSILSLVYFCETGKIYWKYFYGINPLMDLHEIASRFYLNLFFLHKGEKDKVDGIISKFKDDITVTSQNQSARLNMVCKNDAFLNAFTNTQITGLFLSMDMEDVLKKSFDKFEQARTVK